ncbi:MAG: hypothetical protein JNL40_13250 [Cyclobacteriaceae bacterium]|nr:hypothetical protein [Cyclobacteriaceae bacterium]
MIRLLAVLLLFSTISFAQSKRIQPGKVYEAGDGLFAPRLGFRASVPTGWTGVLPRESEVFLLTSYTSPAEIFVLGREGGTLEQLKKSWEAGIELDDQIKLKATGANLTNGLLTAEVVATGDFINKSFRGFAVARCSDSGPCVTCLAVMPAQQYEEIKKATEAFMAAASFEAPSLASPYADFVWKDFLNNKMVTTYAFLENGSKESTIHLCADGHFSAKVTKKGILKNQNPQYKGKMSGTWTVEGVGEKARLRLTFDKGLPGLDTELTIKEEKIFAGGERYFVGNSDQCK